MHKITRDTAERYINGGFYKKYPISKKVPYNTLRLEFFTVYFERRVKMLYA